MKKLLTICLMLLGAVAQAQNFAITATTEAAIRKNIVKGNAANYGFGMINDTLKLVGLTTRNVIFTGSTSKTDIGLGNVDNTSDLNKPVSTATQTALNLKQNQLNGTGFVKATGTTISYDNSTYLSTSSASLTYLPINNPTATGTLTAPTIANSLGANFATTSGNVGIGIASPAYKLDVSGTARFTGAATFTGGVISNGGGGISTNTAIGSGSLAANTNGDQNTAIGFGSLFSNTTGGYNSSVGFSSLALNTTGIQNTATGYQSLYSNTSAIYNSAIGFGSLFSNTTGSYNVAIGGNSGRFISGGSTANTIANNSIFIGAESKALANTQTNQIVIGTNAVGNGSNTTVLGNTSTTQTQIFGNTIFSNTSQAVDTGEKLQVNGTSKFSGNSLFTGTIQVSSTTGLSVDYANRFNSIVFSRQGIPTNYTNVISNSWSGTTTDQTMNFEIGNGLTSRVTALTLVGNGNVGIGTASPTSKIHVIRTGVGIQDLLTLDNLNQSVGVLDGVRLNLRGFNIEASSTYGSSDNILNLGFSTSKQITLLQNGRVGIGTTTDAGYLLDVNGTARVIGNSIFSGNVGIGTTSPNASSILDIASTTKGVLFPRMTTTEINAISSPTDGLTVYNTTLKAICFYDSSAAVWKRVSHSNM